MRIRVLGPVEVEHEGEILPVGGPQQRRLLALLVVRRGHAVSTGLLIDALWPADDAPEGAARSMRTYLSRLRTALPASAITTHRGSYMLDLGDAELDLDMFDSLIERGERAAPDRAFAHYDEALALWRGRPFGEFADEWWALPEASRVVERRTGAEEARAAALMVMGHLNRAVPELERLVAEHPLREVPVRLLMQALQVTGRRAEALRVGRAFRARLAEQTGLDPSADLGRLESSIAVDGAPPAADWPLRGYVIHEAIGEGAHGRVYVGTQPGTDRRVAIKAIRPDLADSSAFVRRFDAEARLVARLEHPHIVPLYDYWREPGGAYLVFRLLGGGTVRDSLISGGPWSLPRVSRLVEEVGGALMAAHAAGVVHNDVRASNVLLDDEGAAYLTDFGIAATLDDPPAPGATERDDVRSFGWMVWELLAGTPAEAGTRSALAVDGRRDRVPSLVGRMPAVPEGLDAVLARATVREGGYATVAELMLGWRAATGPLDGERVQVTSDHRRGADSARRLAARRLASAAVAGVNPYRGLRPFDEADAQGFHGRGDVVAELLRLVAASPVTTVVGASGSGKSSVVRAGLVPELRRDGHVVVVMVPGDDPVASLREALNEIATSADVEGSEVPVVPVDALDDVARRLGSVVVVVDQFEECWTRAGTEAREAFLAVVTRTIADASIDVRFVATVRADLLDRPLEHPSLGQRVGAGAYVLSPLSPAQLDEAIMLPAAQVGVGFEDGVVADLVADAATSPASLPLLQFTLTELYDKRVDSTMTRDGLDSIGGIAGAIGRRAETVYSGLDEAGQAEARELFSRLVTPGSGAPDSRRRALHGELSPGMRQVADRFVEARLLVTDRDVATREPSVEVAHEALLTRWSRLVGWLDEDRRWLAQLQHLSAAARAWDAAGRREGELYRGVRLEGAIEALDVEGRGVSALERAYVDAGRDARDADVTTAQSTARRLRRRLTAVAVALVVALLASAVAFSQRRSAIAEAESAAAAERAAEIEALVGRADAIRPTQRDVAALLAIEANRLADTAGSRSALLSSVTGDQAYLDTHRLPPDDGPRPTKSSPFEVYGWEGGRIFTPDEPAAAARAGIVLPDGAGAYVAGLDGRARPYDLEDGAVGPPLPPVADDLVPFNAGILAASADSSRLAHAVPDPAAAGHLLGVYDTATGAVRAGPIGVGGYVESMVLSPDGGTVFVSMLDDGSVRVFDVATGAQRGTIAYPGPADRLDWQFGVGLAPLGSDAVVIGSAIGIVRVVDVASLAVTSTITTIRDASHALRSAGDGASVVGAGPGGIALLDTATASVQWSVEEPENCWHLAVVAPADALYCGDHYGRIDVRDLTTGTVRSTLNGQNGNTGSLWAASDGTELVSFANNEAVVSRWRLDGTGPVTSVVAHGSTTSYISPDGEVVVAKVPAYDGRRLHLALDYAARLVVLDDGRDVVSLADMFVPTWAPDGDLVGIAVDEDGGIRFARYELDARRLRIDGELLAGDVGNLPSVDPGKARTLYPYDAPEPGQALLRAVDVATNRHVGPSIEVDSYTSSTISSSGHRVVAATVDGIVVFDGDTGERVGEIPGNDLRIAFITVTDQLFVGSLSGELVQYDLETLEQIRSFGGSRGAVQEVYGTADGTTIVVRGGDGLISLFDVETGVRLGPAFTTTPDDLLNASLSLDGRTMTYGGGMRAPVRVVDLDPASWSVAACRIAGRNLTRDEWATYLGDLAPYRATCPEFPVPGE